MNDDRPTLERIRSVVGQVCTVDPSSIPDNARLLAFGVDSIRVIDLVLSLEEEFSVQLEPERLFEVTTVTELARYIEGLTALKQRMG